MNVAFYVLGCKVNQYEAEGMARLFKKRGYNSVSFDSVADVYVVHTCAVTSTAASKSRQLIRKAKRQNKDAIVVVTGCYAQSDSQAISAMAEADIVIGSDKRSQIVNYVDRWRETRETMDMVEDIMQIRTFEELPVGDWHRTRAFLKIQEGCCRFCAYCIVPYTRGPVRSRDPKSLLDEVIRLADKGFREIVLTGVNLGLYGTERDNGTSLASVITQIHEIDGIDRIRVGSVEPVEIDEPLLKALTELPKVCAHYHIPLQSGDDEVLKRMKRSYTTKDYQKIIDRLRDIRPNAGFGADVILGFPGETEEQYQNTLDFCRKIGFSRMHVFPYSRREGTLAYNMEGQLPNAVKNKRAAGLRALGEELSSKFHSLFIGATTPILLEKQGEDGAWEGLTENYIRVVTEPLQNRVNEGDIVPVYLKSVSSTIVYGEIIVK